MIKLSRRDGYGFLLAVALTTSPLLVATAFYEFMSKDGPSGLRVYILPAAVGFLTAIPASGCAIFTGRESGNRVGHHVMCAILVSLLTFLTYCTMIM